MKKAIVSERAPSAIGPYSQGISRGELVFVSGQIPVDPAGKIPEGLAAQTDQALRNVAAVLSADGLSLENVLKTTVYLTDLSQFAVFNEVYAKHFHPPYPARATVQVSALPKGVGVEIEAIAAR